MARFLLLGFLLGLRHALDADHVAAVVSLATRGGSLARQARQGALWGLGHTSTLLLVGGACVLLGVAIPREAERWFEGVVGAMLVLLGTSVLLRLRRARVQPPGGLRAVLVGAVHGLAGSAALVLVVASSAASPAEGLLTIALFGLGSILGMVAIAIAIALSLNAASAHPLLCGSAGAFSVILGARILWGLA